METACFAYIQNGQKVVGKRTTGVISGVAYFSGKDDNYDANVAISQTGVLFQARGQSGAPLEPNMKPSRRVP